MKITPDVMSNIKNKNMKTTNLSLSQLALILLWQELIQETHLFPVIMEKEIGNDGSDTSGDFVDGCLFTSKGFIFYKVYIAEAATGGVL